MNAKVEWDGGHRDDGRWWAATWTEYRDKYGEKVRKDGPTVRAEERGQVGGIVHLKSYDPEVGDSGGYTSRTTKMRVRDRDTLELVDEAVEEVRRRMTATRKQLEEEGPSSASLRTRGELGPVCQLWRTEVLEPKDVSDDTIQRRTRDTKAAVRYWGEDTLVDHLREQDFTEIIRDRASGRIDAHGRPVEDADERVEVSKPVAASLVRTLRQVFRWAEGHRVGDPGSGRTLISEDPTRGVDLPSGNGGGKPQRPYYDDQEYEALLKVAPRVTPGGSGRGRIEETDDGAVSLLPTLLVLAHETGRRIGAIVKIRASDWNPDEGRHGTIRWRAEEDKLGEEWTAPVTEAVREALRRHLREVVLVVGDSPLFPAPRSEGAVRSDVTLEWLRRAEKLTRKTDDVMSVETVKGRGWHGFRRLWAMKRKDMSPQDVGHVGGWKDPTTLQMIYQQPDPDTMQEVVDAGRRKRVER